MIQSIAALAASSAIFAVLAVRGAFSDAQTGSEGFARLAVGAGFALGVIGVVLTFLVLFRVTFHSRIAKLLTSRTDARSLEVVRNSTMVAVARFRGHDDETPYFLSLIVDTNALEIWGGLFRLRCVLGIDWSEIGDVRVGATMDGRQAYECLEIDLPGATPSTMPIVVTGRGLGGFGAIEGSTLEALVAELNQARQRSETRRP